MKWILLGKTKFGSNPTTHNPLCIDFPTKNKRSPCRSNFKFIFIISIAFSLFMPELRLPQLTVSTPSSGTGCSLIAVFFCDFSELCKFCYSAAVLPAWCVYTHWHRGKTEKGKSQEYFKIFEKSTIFNEHPVKNQK